MREKAAETRLGRHTVAAVVADGFSAFEFAVACEVFGTDRSPVLGLPWYRFVICSADRPAVQSSIGFTITTRHGLDALSRADTIVVPTLQHGDGGERLAEALRRAHRRGARLLSFCTGAFVLAAAGLLDGRRVTTHWAWADELRARYPTVRVDPDVLYIDDNDILTSAGTAASIDLALHVVRQDYGAEIANAVARRMVIPPHRDGGQAQFIASPVPDVAAVDLFGQTVAWMQANLDQPITVADMARRAAMSPRTFARRFRNTTGTTPHQWLLRQRVLYAQELLEITGMPVDAVASRCGMGTAANLRQHFNRILRTSPHAYRSTFSAASA